MITDWSAHFTKAEQSLKKASEAMLLGEYEQGAMEVLKAKAFLDAVMLWVCKHD
jgi:hypothetical protein